ncbi:MAG TPA: hypothetical protein VFV38_35075, partial [Ktedonobacteraceae bacterium]|nr:hypothetical protein [Ktedonobacteraceae bacterium]
ISLSFLGALNFAKPFAEIDEIFEILLDNCSIREKFVGVDINVLPEDFHKFVQYTPPLLALQRQGMKINLHLGELFANAFSKEVLASLIPQRIGHGVKLLDDESLVRFLKQHDICLDMCPVSNTRLGVHNWQFPNNPAKRAIKLGIPVTINTDDPVLLQTTLSQEFQLAHLNAEEISIVQANTRKYGYFHG